MMIIFVNQALIKKKTLYKRHFGHIKHQQIQCLNNFIVLAINIYWSEHCIIKNVIRRRNKCLCGNIVKT